MDTFDPHEILGIAPGAGSEEIRAAYLRKVKEYPPERNPQQFEKVRDAYDILRDPRRRIRQLLFDWDPLPPLERMIKGRKPIRRFAGPKPWLAAMKEK